MKKTMAYLLLFTMLLMAQGCMRALSEGAGKVTGAKGMYADVKPVSGSLGEYTRFELGQITDETERFLPADFMGYLPTAFNEELMDKGIPNMPGGKTLTIRGKIVHYEDSSKFGAVLGPLEEVICRTELVDASSGRVLGMAICIGRTKETVNMGVEKKAQGLAKAFVKWIDENYPKEKRIDKKDKE